MTAPLLPGQFVPGQLITADWAIKYNPIGYWLMACYVYEELDVELMADAEFDALAVWLDENWHSVKGNYNADLLDPDFLKSSLGANLPREEWPTRIFFAAHAVLDGIYGQHNWGKPGQSFTTMMKNRFPSLPYDLSKDYNPADLVDLSDLC